MVRKRSKMPKGEHDEKLAQLHAWQEFQRILPTLDSEQEVQEYMDLERNNFNRLYVMLRIHGRYCILRARREKSEIVAECGG